MNKEAFEKIWKEHMEPLFADGTLKWECSEELSGHLIKVADGEYTDDEIHDLINAGKL